MKKQSDEAAVDPVVSGSDVSRLPVIIALIAVLASTLFASLYISEVNSQSGSVGQVVVQKIDASEPIAVVVDEDVAEYRDENFGFIFTYPERWGGAIVNDFKGRVSGAGASVSFTKRPYISAHILSADYEAGGGRDGGCFHGGGVVSYESLFNDRDRFQDRDISRDDESVEKGQETRSIQDVQTSTDSVIVVDGFHAGVVDAPGICTGFSSKAYRKLDTGRIEGVAVRFGSLMNANYNGIPFSWAEDFIEEPSDFYDEDDYSGYLGLVDSIKKVE